MEKNTATIEVDPEVQAAEARLREAEAAKAAAYARADDPGELAAWPEATWKRLPLPEPEATRLKSDADYVVAAAEEALAAARRPKLPVAQACEQLAAAEAALADAQGHLAQINRDLNSPDPRRRLVALDADRDKAAKAVNRGLAAAEVARATVRDSEQREKTQRRPLFETRARGVAKRIDAKLDEIAEIVREAAALHEQATAAQCSFESPVYPGLMPAVVEEWRARQRHAGRL